MKRKFCFASCIIASSFALSACSFEEFFNNIFGGNKKEFVLTGTYNAEFDDTNHLTISVDTELEDLEFTYKVFRDDSSDILDTKTFDGYSYTTGSIEGFSSFVTISVEVTYDEKTYSFKDDGFVVFPSDYKVNYYADLGDKKDLIKTEFSPRNNPLNYPDTPFYDGKRFVKWDFSGILESNRDVFAIYEDYIPDVTTYSAVFDDNLGLKIKVHFAGEVNSFSLKLFEGENTFFNSQNVIAVNNELEMNIDYSNLKFSSGVNISCKANLTSGDTANVFEGYYTPDFYLINFYCDVDNRLLETIKAQAGKGLKYISNPLVQDYELVSWDVAEGTIVNKNFDVHGHFERTLESFGTFTAIFTDNNKIKVDITNKLVNGSISLILSEGDKVLFSKDINSNEAYISLDPIDIDFSEYVDIKMTATENGGEPFDFWKPIHLVPTKYKINFYSVVNGFNSLLLSEYQENGKSIAYPEIPEIDNYLFSKWSYSGNVSKNMDVYGEYIKDTTHQDSLTASFDDLGNLNVSGTSALVANNYEIIITENNKVVKNATVKGNKHEFTCTFSDLDYRSKVDVKVNGVYGEDKFVIGENIDILPLFYEVQFYSNIDNSLLGTSKIKPNTGLSYIDEPVIEDYEFLGWDLEAGTLINQKTAVYGSFKRTLESYGTYTAELTEDNKVKITINNKLKSGELILIISENEKELLKQNIDISQKEISLEPIDVSFKKSLSIKMIATEGGVPFEFWKGVTLTPIKYRINFYTCLDGEKKDLISSELQNSGDDIKYPTLKDVTDYNFDSWSYTGKIDSNMDVLAYYVGFPPEENSISASFDENNVLRVKGDSINIASGYQIILSENDKIIKTIELKGSKYHVSCEIDDLTFDKNIDVKVNALIGENYSLIGEKQGIVPYFYIVTFKNKLDGSLLGTINVKANTEIQFIDDPIIVDYDFKGWDKEAGTIVDSNMVVNGSFERTLESYGTYTAELTEENKVKISIINKLKSGDLTLIIYEGENELYKSLLNIDRKVINLDPIELDFKKSISVKLIASEGGTPFEFWKGVTLTPSKYKVNYYTYYNGEKKSLISSIYKDNNVNIDYPNIPDIDNFLFDKWSYDGVVDQNMDVFAYYKIDDTYKNSLNASFDEKGTLNVSGTSQLIAHGYEIIISEGDNIIKSIKIEGTKHEFEYSFENLKYSSKVKVKVNGVYFNNPFLIEESLDILPLYYTVTYYNGLTNTVIGTKNINVGEDISYVDVPNVKDYTFTKWSYDGKVNKNMNVTAEYRALENFKVHFIYDDVEIKSAIVQEFSYASIASSLYEHPYKYFNGWTVNGEVIDLTTYKITQETYFYSTSTPANYVYSKITDLGNNDYLVEFGKAMNINVLGFELYVYSDDFNVIISNAENKVNSEIIKTSTNGVTANGIYDDNNSDAETLVAFKIHYEGSSDIKKILHFNYQFYRFNEEKQSIEIISVNYRTL